MKAQTRPPERHGKNGAARIQGRLMVVTAIVAGISFAILLGYRGVSPPRAVVASEQAARVVEREEIRVVAPPVADELEKAETPVANGERALARLKAEGGYESLTDAVRAARYAMERLDPARETSRGAAFFAENPAQQLRAWFGREGVEFASGRREDWSLTLRLAAPGATVEARDYRAELRRAGVVEWYENTPAGIEQGFTVSTAPAGGNGELRVAMEVGGDLRAVAESEDAIVFHTAAGQPVLRYADLHAWDAAGRALAARMERADSRLALVVDARDATYPVTIDPTITTISPQAKLVADGSERESSFAYAVGLDGDTAVFGGYSATTPNGVGSGAAWVFVRNGTVWNQQAKLIASDGAEGDSFGDSIAISGDSVIVGCPGSDVQPGYTQAGAAYVFVRSGTTWTEQQKLNVTVTQYADSLGRSVAIDRDTAVVGATGIMTKPGTPTGAAYVFTRSGTVWTQQAMLAASDGAAGDYFGQSVSVNGDIAVVGSPYASVGATYTGAAYVFNRSGGTWTEDAKLSASDAAETDIFGYSVSVSGTTALIGSYRDSTIHGAAAGSAYVFAHDGTAWIEQAHLVPGTGGPSFSFGWSVALSGDTALVGSRNAASGGLTGAGAAHVFVRNGTTWSEQQALDPGDGQLYGIFGCAVALSGDRALVGAALTDSSAGTRCGSGYIFNRTGTTWTAQAKLTIAGGAPDDFLGYAVALDGNTAVVGAYQADTTGGANAGCAYVFQRGGNVWAPQAKLTASDGDSEDRFGSAAAISGEKVLIGAPADDHTTTVDAGSAYVFLRIGKTWSLQEKVVASDGAAWDNFGRSVALDGDKALIGASGVDGASGPDHGAVYAYLWLGWTWGEEQKLTHDTLNTYDQFGYSVALSGDLAIIGAPSSDFNGSDSGLAYAFVWNTPTYGGWAFHSLLNGSAGGGEYFGFSVALDGDTALIGAPFAAGAGGAYQGKAVVFVRQGASWDLPVTLTASDGAADDNFGYSVALDGDRAAVGSWLVDTGARQGVGAAYVFTRAGTAWNFSARLMHDDAAEYDRLGWAIAVSGDTVLVGTSVGDTIIGTDTGSAYVFVLPTPPRLAPITIASTTNVNPLYARAGDTIALVFTSDKPLQTPTVTIAGHGVTPVNTSGNTWGASLVVAAGDPQGQAEFSITATALDGTIAGPITAPTDGSSVKIDTVAPMIGGDFSPLVVADGTNLADYTPQATVGDASGFTLVQTPAPGTALSSGTTTVTLTATDDAGNVGTHDFDVNVRPPNPVSAMLLAKGAPAPGIGTPAGPPADALLTSFGPPAIDDLGNVAFTARWHGEVDGKGAGVFTATKLIAAIGGPVPGSDATFRRLGDPVIDGGRVAFIATLADVPKVNASAVLSDVFEAGIAVIAQTGTAAPGAGGATFKSFKAVALEGGSLAVFAQLKAPAASDLGVWVQDATRPLTLVLREGQTVGTRTIKTLVTFAAGNGSPGAGRGWLLAPGGTPHVLALALFTDKTQAIIDARIDGNVIVYSQSGPGGAGGPTIAGASFASYSVPVANGDDDVAFLGSLIVGAGGVTKANARGIFAKIGSALYTPILRVGDVVSSSGAFVSVLKDPVFARDGTLAFPATLKGGDFKGLTTTTLFWKRQTGGLDLLAQGGAGNRPVPGLPDAQFKSFPSLAVASGRGPLFTATLVPGKGGVTKANASGVWAMDFNHTLRLLFRTGDTIGGKVVKSFTLLKATRGSTGVTRSFNEAGQVAWLATFTDKTTAIVVSEVP